MLPPKKKVGNFVGGVASPLLANIALYGLEDAVKKAGGPEKQRENGRIIRHTTFCVRYADDFVVFNTTWDGIQRCKEAIQAWLNDMGLELQDTKTRYAHTLEAKEECHGNVGFDFLNFTIRQFPVGKYKSKKLYKTIIQPSKNSIARHWKALAEIIERMKATTLDDVIRMINPKIAGWCAYFKTEVSSQAFQRLDNLLWHKIYRWAKRKHSKKSADWVVQQYFKPDGKSKHGRVEGQTQTLRWHRNTPVKRHVTLRKGVSPYDGNWSYWGTRRGKYRGLETTRGKLLKHQGGRCTHGRLFFTVDDTIEIYHADGNHNPTTSPDTWPLTYSFTSCCSCPLRTPSLGSELAVAVPPAHMRSPLTPVRSLGEGQALATGRLSSPSTSAEVIHPRVWTCRGPFITPCSAWDRSLSVRSAPSIMRRRGVDALRLGL